MITNKIFRIDLEDFYKPKLKNTQEVINEKILKDILECNEKKLNDTVVQFQREGLNRLFAEKLLVDLKSGEVVQITYFDQPDGIFFPMNKIDGEEKYIKGFKRNPGLRPKSAQEMRKDIN